MAKFQDLSGQQDKRSMIGRRKSDAEVIQDSMMQYLTGKTYGDVAYDTAVGLPLQALNQLLKLSPMNLANQQVLGQQQQQMMQPGPYQKGAEKALKAAGENHVNEALLQGLDPQMIQNSPIMTPLMQQNNMAERGGPMQAGQPGQGAPQPGIPQQAPMGQPGQPQGQPNQQNILQQLMSLIHTPGSFDQSSGNLQTPSFFGMQSEFANERFLNNQGKKQELLGQKPFQAGEREKQSLEHEKDYNVAAMNANATAGSKIGDYEFKISEAFEKDIDEYKSVLPRVQSLREFVNDPKKQYDSGVSDLFIINEALKIIDPNSVNREGEVKTMSQAEGRLRRSIKAAGLGFIKGEKLTQAGRKEILKGVENKFGKIKDYAKKSYSAHGEKVKSYGGSPERALRMPQDTADVDPAAIAEAKRRGLI